MPGERPTVPDPKPETILVVDDTEAVLHVVSAILESRNFRVLTANSGPCALRLASGTEEPIHLLLSDIEMPEMSGPELCKALQKARPEIQIMLMSGANQGDPIPLHEGWAFIEKPFGPDRLVHMIREVLHRVARTSLVR